MSDHPRQPSSLSDACRRVAARTRPVHGAALAALVVAAFGLIGLRSIDLPGPTPIDPGDRLHIEVVHPVEPDIAPGSVMDVGDLVDGLTEIPRPRPPDPMPATYAYLDETWDFGLPPLPPRAVYDELPIAYPPRPEPRAERDGGWFGFDAPRRDYQAERDARRARLDALERRERDRDQAWRERRELQVDRWRGPPPPPPPEADAPWDRYSAG